MSSDPQTELMARLDWLENAESFSVEEKISFLRDFIAFMEDVTTLEE